MPTPYWRAANEEPMKQMQKACENKKRWKQCPYKPGSVSRQALLPAEPSVIYLLRKSPCVSSILPSTVSSRGTRAGHPQTMVYMNLQPSDGTAR